MNPYPHAALAEAARARVIRRFGLLSPSHVRGGRLLACSLSHARGCGACGGGGGDGGGGGGGNAE